MAVSFFVLPKRHDKLSRRHICQISKTNNCNIRNVIHVSQNDNPAVQDFNDASYIYDQIRNIGFIQFSVLYINNFDFYISVHLTIDVIACKI